MTSAQFSLVNKKRFPETKAPRNCLITKGETGGGRMWESNPPGPFVRSHTGFEVQRRHQTPCPPGAAILSYLGASSLSAKRRKALPPRSTRRNGQGEGQRAVDAAGPDVGSPGPAPWAKNEKGRRTNRTKAGVRV